MKSLTFALCLGLIANIAFSEEDPSFLDPQYKNLVHPLKDKNSMYKFLPASDTKDVISYQSPVRTQEARGTCSIFSATAYLEGLLIKKGFNPSIDLSEEWLQYTAVRNNSSDGSSAWANFKAIKDYGMASEQSLPYIGEDWTQVSNPLKETRCGSLSNNAQLSCLIVHRDPSLLSLTDAQIKEHSDDVEFINAREEALNFKKDHIKFSRANFLVTSVSDIKVSLQGGTPLVLELDFYYGAWNHRKASELGIERNMDHWAKGIVAYPESDSMDFIQSLKHPAGHSVLVVGYDDNKIVERSIKMKDGTTKTFTHKGVYYFKNSWGTSSFGNNFQIDGQNFPGYGMIVAKYAEEIGQFFKMPLL